MNLRAIAPLLAALASQPLPARACGCFAPPDPALPVVQAGERILFARWDNQIVAHIQIQYAGDAQDFGWLVPLPSLPVLDLGTDELFTKLSAATQPTYTLDYSYPDWNACTHDIFGGGAQSGAADMGASLGDGGAAAPSPLVIEDSIGPYDYAVLKADDKTAMLDWLKANRYFVPGGTDAVLAPYLHPGAYVLALKLKSGKSAGDLQPIVLRYTSDLPMIPIALTSTGAQPHMGIAVWLLGDGRAIPRNYYHTVLNDAQLEWRSGSNYRDVLIRAVAEAPGKHSFVTEYAGPAAPFQSLLDYPGRFGDPAEMKTLTDPVQYLRYLRDHGYYFGGALVAILQKYIPVPDNLFPPANAGTYYYNIDTYLGRGQGPDPALKIDPVALTDEIQPRVVVPARAAAQLFATYPTLTRLFTTLSPEDMTRDPVFSFNPFLPDVPIDHRGKLIYRCSSDRSYVYDAALYTEQGFAIDMPGGDASLPAMPYSLRTEILRESGLPEVVTDNHDAIAKALSVVSPPASGHGGCALERRPSPRPWPAALALLAFLGAGALVARRRSR
jgi:Uncharacterized protein conserved in bacteria (DUF2330)